MERVTYSVPVEITDRAGSFMIKARLQDVSPLAAKVKFIRAPRLQPGDNVIVTIWKNIRVENAVDAFRAPATVFACRTPDELVLVFDEPRALVAEGFGKFVYGPLLLASLNTMITPNDPIAELSVETLRQAARRYADVARDAGALRIENDARWRSHSYVRPSERRERK
ncbi:MAG TPA: hypothetical protein V6D05_01570 [Stenomitos sp.]